MTDAWRMRQQNITDNPLANIDERLSTHNAIAQAVASLPTGHCLRIELSRGRVDVLLMYPSGGYREYDCTAQTLGEIIKKALDETHHTETSSR